MQYVSENFTIQALTWENFRTIWTTSYLQNYAPLHMQLYSLLHAVWKLNPAAYHLTQMLLHMSCVLLLLYVLGRLEQSRVAFLAALWFAVFGPNVETVAWVSEIKSTLAFLFFLISLRYFMRFREEDRNRFAVWCAVFLVLSLLAKISTVVAPAVFLAYDWRDGSRPSLARLKSLAPFVVISVIFALIHLFSSHEMQEGAVERLRDAAIIAPAGAELSSSGSYFGGLLTHVLNVPGLVWHYFSNSLVPHGLSPWRMVPIETAFTLHSAMLWAGGLLALVFVALAPGSWRFWSLWFLLFLAPVLQLVPNATWVADRYLYIPAIGVFVIVSKAFFGLLDRMKSPAVNVAAQFLVVAGLTLLGWQAAQYTMAWRSELALWTAALPNCPTSAFCYFKLGETELDEHTGDPIAHLNHAVSLRPETSYVVARARAYTEIAGDYAQADELFLQMQRESRKLPQRAITSIARNHYLAGNLDRANRAIETGLLLNPNYSSLLVVKGFVQWREKDFDSARYTLRRALQLNHANQKAHHPPMFLLEVWQRPAEVGQLLHDIGPL